MQKGCCCCEDDVWGDERGNTLRDAKGEMVSDGKGLRGLLVVTGAGRERYVRERGGR